MQQIEIDFEVFKALTAMRTTESVTYNDVIRELMGLEKSPSLGLLERLNATLAPGAAGKPASLRFISRGLSLPDGTLLRVTYKGVHHSARIEGGLWVGSDGVRHSSPSGAAKHITGTNVNGLRFWQAKRPSDTEWRSLEALAS